MAQFDVQTTGREVVQAFGAHAVGKTILITGPSQDGLGAEIAKLIASANPSHLLLAGRNEAKVAPVIEEIKEENPKVDITFVQCDLTDNSSVRQAAAHVNRLVHKLDVILNNAGMFGGREFHKSTDGVESTFAACHLGHFLLTNLVMDKLTAARGLVVNMTSSAYGLDATDTQDPNFNEGKDYNPWKAYGRAKTANILFTIALADRFGGKGVASFAVDPGMVTGTKIMDKAKIDDELMQQGLEMVRARSGGKPLPPHRHVSLEQGCASAVLVCLDSSLRARSPAYVKECAIIPTLPYASDKKIADELWKLSEKLAGQAFNP